MPRRRQFHEPEIQQEASPLRGLHVTITGDYVLLDDVITVLRQYADANQAEQVWEAADWLRTAQQLSEELSYEEGEQIAGEINYDQPEIEVDRVEVYPENPDDPNSRWIARACADDGTILDKTRGDIHQENVLRDAEGRWPGVPVHLVAEYMVDTVWEEQAPTAVRSPHTKRRRPSPKRLWPAQ